MSPTDRGWQSFGPVVRRQCPLCEWFMDEPPMETASEWTGDSVTFRVRQQSAVPATLAHIVGKHPESDEALQVLGAAASYVAAGKDCPATALTLDVGSVGAADMRGSAAAG